MTRPRDPYGPHDVPYVPGPPQPPYQPPAAAYGQPPAAPPKRGMATWKILAIVGGSLLSLCCVSSVIVGLVVGPPKTQPAAHNAVAAAPTTTVAKPPAPTTPAAAPTTNKPAAPAPTTQAAPPPAPAGPALTGFGATRDEWNAHHTADPDFPESYDRDTSVPRVGNYPGARYITVVIGDRVISYQRNFADPGVPQSEALAEVKADLPGDARVVWQQAKDGNCLQVEYASATLAKMWPDIDAQGMVQVELHSLDMGGAYDPAKVAYAFFGRHAAATPDDALGC